MDPHPLIPSPWKAKALSWEKKGHKYERESLCILHVSKVFFLSLTEYIHREGKKEIGAFKDWSQRKAYKGMNNHDWTSNHDPMLKYIYQHKRTKEIKESKHKWETSPKKQALPQNVYIYIYFFFSFLLTCIFFQYQLSNILSSQNRYTPSDFLFSYMSRRVTI